VQVCFFARGERCHCGQEEHVENALRCSDVCFTGHDRIAFRCEVRIVRKVSMAWVKLFFFGHWQLNIGCGPAHRET